MSQEDEHAIEFGPADFLESLSEKLRERKNYDLEVANIITKHILLGSPEENCVGDAKQAFLDLAAARANPPEAETNE